VVVLVVVLVLIALALTGLGVLGFHAASALGRFRRALSAARTDLVPRADALNARLVATRAARSAAGSPKPSDRPPAA